MPYPRQLTKEKILGTAVEMLKSKPEVDLRPLARKLGVQAPSLYRYFRSKEALQRGLAEEGYRLMGLALRSAIAKEQSLDSLAQAYRRFAFSHPRLYHLMHRPGYEPAEEGEVADTVVNPVAQFFGLDRFDEKFIAIFRALRAYVHGFVSLELSNQFSWRGNVTKAYEQGLALFKGLRERKK